MEIPDLVDDERLVPLVGSAIAKSSVSDKMLRPEGASTPRGSPGATSPSQVSLEEFSALASIHQPRQPLVPPLELRRKPGCASPHTAAKGTNNGVPSTPHPITHNRSSCREGGRQPSEFCSWQSIVTISSAQPHTVLVSYDYDRHLVVSVRPTKPTLDVAGPMQLPERVYLHGAFKLEHRPLPQRPYERLVEGQYSYTSTDGDHQRDPIRTSSADPPVLTPELVTLSQSRQIVA